MSRNREIKRIQEKEFAEEWNLFLWKNAREQEESLLCIQIRRKLCRWGGHYIYYEKNPEMQNYMINTRRENGVTPSEVVEDRAAKDFRSAVREKWNIKNSIKVQNLLIYQCTSGVDCAGDRNYNSK